MLNIHDIYRKFAMLFIYNNEEVPDVDSWLKYLNNLPEARDEIDKSYLKYLCRKYYVNGIAWTALNALSIVALLYFLPKIIRIDDYYPPSNDNALHIIEVDNVVYDDIIPEELLNKYSRVTSGMIPKPREYVISKNGRKLLIKCIAKHPISFYYQLYCFKEICIHSRIIKDYNPKAVAVYVNERNIATPLLRKLYEDSGREFDSFMHGEYLLHLIQAYTSFTNFYVWDEMYKEMFSNCLNYDCGNYVVYTPKKLQNKHLPEFHGEKYFLTYYFSGESIESLRKISELFEVLETLGYSCCVRPHPRDSHYDLIKELFNSNRIEDPYITSIEKSLAQAKYIVGLNSTVLFEALSYGKTVVIDDYSWPEAFHSLSQRKFRLLNNDYLKLTTLLRDIIE